jgi:TetR/AcrR family fatty acid metabolism transcriptional regulator
MSPKYVDKKQKAKEIAGAALQVFYQKGYAAASIDQIAAAAGIAKGTVYEYFPSKDRLYLAAIMVFVEEFEDAMLERLKDIEDPFLKLTAYVGYVVDFCREENSGSVRIIFDVLQQSILENGLFVKRKYLVREMMLGPRKILTDIVLDGVSRGVFHAHIARSAETLATNILAFLDGASLHYLITENYFNMTVQLEQWMTILASLLLINPNEYDVDELIAQAVGR